MKEIISHYLDEDTIKIAILAVLNTGLSLVDISELTKIGVGIASIIYIGRKTYLLKPRGGRRK